MGKGVWPFDPLRRQPLLQLLEWGRPPRLPAFARLVSAAAGARIAQFFQPLLSYSMYLAVRSAASRPK